MNKNVFTTYMETSSHFSFFYDLNFRVVNNKTIRFRKNDKKNLLFCIFKKICILLRFRVLFNP